jgi:glutamyl-tRNA reductase
VNSLKSIADFYVVGINYRKADTAVRGHYAMNQEQYGALLQEAARQHLSELFVVSTCNRTELYGIAPSAKELTALLGKQTKGSADELAQLVSTYQGKQAIEHLFRVAAGLDSQILGDYEIVGQIKQSVSFAKSQNMIGLFLEKLFNNTLQSSRAIRSNTKLSSGTVSVSFAAAQYIARRMPDAAGKKILLVGTGKIGRNTCKNLVDCLQTRNITLLNRTNEKAAALAQELGLQSAPYEDLSEQLKQADVILVSTNAEQPTILKAQLEGCGDKLVIDLSIPNNVETSVATLPGVVLVNVDELSKVNDETLQMRSAEVPKAKAIIEEHMAEFKEWYLMRKNVPVIKAVKNKLETLKGGQVCAAETTPQDQEKIQQVLNVMATKMRHRNQGGCNYIEALNDFMTRS